MADQPVPPDSGASDELLELDGLLDEALDGFKQPISAGTQLPREDGDSTFSPGGSTADSSAFPNETQVRDERTKASTSGHPEGLLFNPLKKSSCPKTRKAAPAPVLPQDVVDTLSDEAHKLARGMAGLMRELSDANTGEPQMVNGESKMMDLAATLSSLAEKTRATAGPEVVPDEVNDSILGKLTEQLGAMEDAPEVQMLVDSLMQQLLSKEVLYQPMKDIACKYPEWLEKNRAALTDEEFQKYSKQHESILSVCALYEQETTDFDKLVQVMQEVQACGQPPADIVSELAPGLQFDEAGLPSFPSMPGSSEAPDQCVIQ